MALKNFALITDIIPINREGMRISNMKILPVLVHFEHFKKFYNLKYALVKRDIPNVIRLDFTYIELISPYLN